jgi:hypothetical protein
MRSFRLWIGATGLLCVLSGGAAKAADLDLAGAVSRSNSPSVIPTLASTGETSSTGDAADASTLLDPQVQPAGANSVAESANNNLVGNCNNLPGDCFDCGCDQSAWIVSAGAVFLHRSRPDPSSIITPSSGPGTLISGSNFGFNWNSGPIISIGRRTKSGWIIEARYFNDRNATANYVVDNVTTFRMAGIGVTILGGGSISASYLTQLDSTELNALKPVNDRVSWIAGFRALQLHDRLDMTIASPGIITNWNEINRLYGAQTGINLNLFQPGRALQFNGALKAGVYGNVADNQFVSRIVSSATSNAASTAFVGELNFTGSYQITERWSATGGYMVLWIDGLALADQTAATTHQAAGGSVSPIRLNGDLWYNGALVSMNYVW